MGKKRNWDVGGGYPTVASSWQLLHIHNRFPTSCHLCGRAGGVMSTPTHPIHNPQVVSIPVEGGKGEKTGVKVQRGNLAVANLAHSYI